MQTQPLIACHQCDLIQYEVSLIAGESALCIRCNAQLYKSTAPNHNQEIALTISAIVMLLIANLFPFATVIVQDQVINATLFNIIQILFTQQQHVIALLIFITLVLAPILEVLTISYLLMQLTWGGQKQYIAYAYNLYLTFKKWVLVDVFMLGVLVALIKLAPILIVKADITVWALAGLVILLTTVEQSFDSKKMWSKIDFYQQ